MSSGELLRAQSISADISEMARMQERAMQRSLRDAEWQMRMLPGAGRPPLPPAPPPPPVAPPPLVSAAPSGDPSSAALACTSQSVGHVSSTMPAGLPSSLSPTIAPQVSTPTQPQGSLTVADRMTAALLSDAALSASVCQNADAGSQGMDAASAHRAALAVQAASAAAVAAAAAIIGHAPIPPHATIRGQGTPMAFPTPPPMSYASTPAMGIQQSYATLLSSAVPTQQFAPVQTSEQPVEYVSSSPPADDSSHDEMKDVDGDLTDGGRGDGHGGGRSEIHRGDDMSSHPRKVIRRHRMTKEEEARFSPEQLRDLQGTTAAKSRKMSATEHDVMLHKRRLRNRQSAARSRDKQRRTIGDVGKEVDEVLAMTEALSRRANAAQATTQLVTAQNAELAAQLVTLRGENEILRKELAAARSAGAVQPTYQHGAPSVGISQPIKMLKRASSSLNLLNGTEILDKVAASAGNALARVTSVSNLSAIGAGPASGFQSSLAFSPQRPPLGEITTAPGRSSSSLVFNVSSDKLDTGGFQTMPRTFSFFERMFDSSYAGASTARPPASSEG